MKTTLHISGMHCPSCAKLIGMNVEDLNGVKEIQINESTGETTVTYNEEKLSEAEIKQAIVSSGAYTVN